MKVISLTEPWATLVAVQEKKFETRSWNCWHRGLIAIHASKGFPRWAKEYAADLEFEAALARHGYSVDALPLGCVVAVCRVVECVRTEHMSLLYPERFTEQEKLFGDYSPGRWAWALEGVIKLVNPVPAKGSLGLWETGSELEKAIVKEVRFDRLSQAS